MDEQPAPYAVDKALRTIKQNQVADAGGDHDQRGARSLIAFAGACLLEPTSQAT